jgi:diguanylate cyclase (GGDEF)-like protein
VNVVMASLSVQLAIYGLSWLVVGMGFRLKRDIALLWAAGWLLGAAGTGLLCISPKVLGDFRDLFVNALVVYSFAALYLGVERYTDHWPGIRILFLLAAGLAAIELLRPLGDASEIARVWLFTAIACLPLLSTAWRMLVWGRSRFKARWPLVIAMIAPVVLTISIFAFRAVWVVVGTSTADASFDKGSNFDLIASLGFLLMLGAFNFSLASLVLGSLIQRLRELSATDQLTGLDNRRVMMGRLEEEHARHQRSGQIYTVVMMDLDHFKQINDTYGHGVGDLVLQGLADILKTCQRRTDTLARTGGEEFMLLMPMTDTDGGLAHARRMCERVAAARIPTPAGDVQITLSLGVAEVLPGETSEDTVVSRADAALCRAKAQGRNQAEAAERAPMPGLQPT